MNPRIEQSRRRSTIIDISLPMIRLRLATAWRCKRCRRGARNCPTIMSPRYIQLTVAFSQKVLQLQNNISYILKPLLWVFRHTSANDPLQTRWSDWIEISDRRRRLINDLMHRVNGGISLEWPVHSRHFIQEATEREDIRPVIYCFYFSLRLLRRHIAQRAQNHTRR